MRSTPAAEISPLIAQFKHLPIPAHPYVGLADPQANGGTRQPVIFEHFQPYHQASSQHELQHFCATWGCYSSTSRLASHARLLGRSSAVWAWCAMC